ncbi:hypothetical protein GCM10023159_13990 [Brevibacterium yomogidense]
MPKTPIDKYYDPRTSEDDVRLPPAVFPGREINSIPEPTGVEDTPNFQFGCRIATSVGLHCETCAD